MTDNHILPFAVTDTGGNLLSQREYAADSQRLYGNQPGVARSTLVNKALRQSTLMAAGVAQFIANHATASDGIHDALSPDAVADYLAAVISGMAGSGSGLPAGGEAGQSLIKQSAADGDATWQAVPTGVPVGTLIAFAGREAPPGFLSLNTDTESFVAVEAYPRLVESVYCGDDFNDDADFFYRFDAAIEGITRNTTGSYLALPAASRYFLRGRDATGKVHPYQYQGDAIRNATGSINARADTAGKLLTSGVFAATDATEFVGASGKLYVLGKVNFDLSTQVPTADENRPINFPVLWCIKAFDALSDPALLDAQKLLERVAQLEAERAELAQLAGLQAEVAALKASLAALSPVETGAVLTTMASASFPAEADASLKNASYAFFNEDDDPPPHAPAFPDEAPTDVAPLPGFGPNLSMDFFSKASTAMPSGTAGKSEAIRLSTPGSACSGGCNCQGTAASGSLSDTKGESNHG